jgi:tetratricopeptide repeat protein 30
MTRSWGGTFPSSCARICWERENYPQVERVLRQAAEFASEHEAWQLGVKHACFMQDGKYREAIRYYEPVVRRRMGGEGCGPGTLLDVTAVVLAILCVAYVMTSQ